MLKLYIDVIKNPLLKERIFALFLKENQDFPGKMKKNKKMKKSIDICWGL